MKVTFDTNIILDVLLAREPFAEMSVQAMRLADKGIISGFITANTVTDISYILSLNKLTYQQIRKMIKELLSFVKIIDVKGRDINRALVSPVEDFEDALLAVCSSRVKSDYIITRNDKDFNESPVPAVTPEFFLKQFA